MLLENWIFAEKAREEAEVTTRNGSDFKRAF